jgi:hypothetical protein
VQSAVARELPASLNAPAMTRSRPLRRIVSSRPHP